MVKIAQVLVVLMFAILGLVVLPAGAAASGPVTVVADGPLSSTVTPDDAHWG